MEKNLLKIGVIIGVSFVSAFVASIGIPMLVGSTSYTDSLRFWQEILSPKFVLVAIFGWLLGLVSGVIGGFAGWFAGPLPTGNVFDNKLIVIGSVYGGLLGGLFFWVLSVPESWANFRFCLSFVFLALILFGGRIFFSYLADFPAKIVTKANWKKFARSENLTFVPISIFPFDFYVFGNYRGHSLKLDFQKVGIRLASEISHNVNQNSRELPRKPGEKELIKLLDPNDLRYEVGDTYIRFSSNENTLIYTGSRSGMNANRLQQLANLLSDIADVYLAIVALGGEAVPGLQAIGVKINPGLLEGVAVQLLRDIGLKTKIAFSQQASHILCPHCLTGYAPHQVSLQWWKTGQTRVTYYGCRTCGQSHEFLTGRDGIVAVLDRDMNTVWSQEGDRLRVNWLARRTLFDFDQVEIVRATDEDVERFAVQVGNDTDPVRKERYQQMQCTISSNCDLSENSKRILQQMFCN